MVAVYSELVLDLNLSKSIEIISNIGFISISVLSKMIFCGKDDSILTN